VKHRLEAWVPRVYRFALRLCGDSHEAEDLTQETFLRAWRRVHNLREERALRVWLFRIAANLWRDRLRRNRSPIARAAMIDDQIVDAVISPLRLAAGYEELNKAMAAMQLLPPKQREALYLSACEGMTPAEVAQVLGISRESAKANLSLARKRMRELLPDVCPAQETR
jgi:RNA polymerase sigma-70 factor, ECF subfamily